MTRSHVYVNRAGILGILLLGAAGCAGPKTSWHTPRSGPMDLHGYECITLQPVEIDPSLGLPGLPAKLGYALAHQLNESEHWVYQGPIWPERGNPNYSRLSTGPVATGGPLDVNQGTGFQPVDSNGLTVSLRVRIIDTDAPAGKRPSTLSEPEKMTCELEVCDGQTGALLGTATVSARSGPTVGQRITLTMLTGRPTYTSDNEWYERQVLFKNVAEKIVRSLDRTRVARS